jgi:hypothetical protein
MSINRHNYEEYFILYVDNELGNGDRLQVEDFVQKHPDLKEELDLLMQYKLEPDTNIVFDGKEELMMQNGYTPISLLNYQEWLTIYIDNELSFQQRTEVEDFVAAHPQIKKELEILQRIKLQPEEIIFTNKELLYRREEKVRIMSWWRITAAAVLILAIGLTTVILVNKKSSNEETIVNIPTNQQKANSVANNKNSDKNDLKSPVTVKEDQQLTRSTVKAPNKNIATKRNDVTNKKQLDNLPVNKDEPIIVDNNHQPSNNLPQPLNTNSASDAFRSDVAKNEISDETNIPKGLLIKDDPVTAKVTPTSYISDEDLNQSNGKKSKLRGFLRKVTRTFEKNTNINATDNEERVLIGGLALKLK